MAYLFPYFYIMKEILFDLDGTILDGNRKFNLFSEFLELYGVQLIEVFFG